MTIELIRDFLAWCTVFNMAALLFWLFFLTVAHDLTYRVHTKWFRITRERFDEIHYKGMMAFKAGLFFFNLVPYLVLRLMF